MTEAQLPHDDALETWLDTATRRLSPESAARVRQEIGEHFESARIDAMATGASTDAARRSALTVLGDAKAVNRHYREVLLTAWEATLLERARRADRSWTSSKTGLILQLSFWGLLIGTGVTQRNPVLVVVAIGYFATFLHALLPVRLMRQTGSSGLDPVSWTV